MSKFISNLSRITDSVIQDSNKRLDEYILGSLRSNGIESAVNIEEHKDGFRVSLHGSPTYYLDVYLDGENLIVESSKGRNKAYSLVISNYARFAGIPKEEAHNVVNKVFTWFNSVKNKSGKSVDNLEKIKISDSEEEYEDFVRFFSEDGHSQDEIDEKIKEYRDKFGDRTIKSGLKELVAFADDQNGRPQYSYNQKAWRYIKDSEDDKLKELVSSLEAELSETEDEEDKKLIQKSIDIIKKKLSSKIGDSKGDYSVIRLGGSLKETGTELYKGEKCSEVKHAVSEDEAKEYCSESKSGITAEEKRAGVDFKVVKTSDIKYTANSPKISDSEGVTVSEDVNVDIPCKYGDCDNISISEFLEKVKEIPDLSEVKGLVINRGGENYEVSFKKQEVIEDSYKIDDAKEYTQEQLLSNPPSWIQDKDIWEKAVKKVTHNGEKSTTVVVPIVLYKRYGGTKALNKKERKDEARFNAEVAREGVEDSFFEKIKVGDTLRIVRGNHPGEYAEVLDIAEDGSFLLKNLRTGEEFNEPKGLFGVYVTVTDSMEQFMVEDSNRSLRRNIRAMIDAGNATPESIFSRILVFLQLQGIPVKVDSDEPRVAWLPDDRHSFWLTALDKLVIDYPDENVTKEFPLMGTEWYDEIKRLSK